MKTYQKNGNELEVIETIEVVHKYNLDDLQNEKTNLEARILEIDTLIVEAQSKGVKSKGDYVAELEESIEL